MKIKVENKVTVLSDTLWEVQELLFLYIVLAHLDLAPLVGGVLYDAS